MGVQLNPGGEAQIKALFDQKAGYARLHAACCQAFGRSQDAIESALSRHGLERLPIMDHEECAKLRQMIDVDSAFLRHRLFLTSLLEKVFTPDVDGRLTAYFGSEYLPLWCRFYRNEPSGVPPYAFAWHCDGGPTRHLKILLYLNDSDEHGGNTHFLDRAATDNFKSIGYVFCDINDRIRDLSELARRHGIPYQPLEWPMRTGDAIIFEPMNILHKGIWPTDGPRYLLQICIVPSPLPWRAACGRFAIPRDNTDWPVVDDSWPAGPVQA